MLGHDYESVVDSVLFIAMNHLYWKMMMVLYVFQVQILTLQYLQSSNPNTSISAKFNILTLHICRVQYLQSPTTSEFCSAEFISMSAQFNVCRVKFMQNYISAEFNTWKLHFCIIRYRVKCQQSLISAEFYFNIRMVQYLQNSISAGLYIQRVLYLQSSIFTEYNSA